VLVYRRSGVVHALADRCSHAGGPLHEGEVDGNLCVTCPWHGSSFRLADGSVVRGPATAPQPAFDARVSEGHVEVRLRPG
jgi:nitrite reductase/ring-hydroxylating ferredoxin subunit